MSVTTLLRKKFVGDGTFDKLKLWVIPVTIKSEARTDTFNLLLDTGAQQTVIIPAVKEIIGLEVTQESIQGIGVTGTSKYLTATLSLEIGSINFTDQNVLVGTLPGLFSRYQIAGILGADVLQFLAMKINYPEKLLEIERTIVHF